ncbi:hypothetical protein BDV97DRAFT_383814 [Delphinella strobiligena]|nr:hypothetical protein BDV97DRAFT_383814 [Delphinella strobiligena]
MNASQTAAGWLSFAVTTIGLGSLISQASVITDKMDPFHETRSVHHLGVWFERQPQFPFWRIAKPPPVGPAINANFGVGFCGTNTVHLSRVPLDHPGQAGWAIFLSVIHQDMIELYPTMLTDSGLEKGIYAQSAKQRTRVLPGWEVMEKRPLIRRGQSACITISRATLLTLLALTNARPIFRHSDAAGLRAAYASYSGQWHIEWPLGDSAVVHFAAHDSHSSATDVYPPSFERRIITGPDFKCAFTGRKTPGRYLLQYVPKGFPGAHGGRHLYNMMGGKVYEVDFLHARKLDIVEKKPTGSLKLTLPSTENGGVVEMFIGEKEKEVIAHAVDCIPWSPLSYSIHRGLRDILVAFCKPRMDRYRARLAETLRNAVEQNMSKLEGKGWAAKFVRQNMGDMAAGAIIAGNGNSGDLVRVVTDVALTLCSFNDTQELDETHFWRSNTDDLVLNQESIIGLIKCFLLEWKYRARLSNVP